MTIALALFALLPSSWFGPSDYQSCAESYGFPATDERLVKIAIEQCKIAFDGGRHDVLRKRALCTAELIPSLRSYAAIEIAIDKCDIEIPAPSCESSKVYRFAYWECQAQYQADGKMYWETDKKLAQPRD